MPTKLSSDQVDTLERIRKELKWCLIPNSLGLLIRKNGLSF
jgi:hypothetical protein